jgi:hypothetical protein
MPTRPRIPRPGRYTLHPVAPAPRPAPVGTTMAPAPATCQGTDWPPMTPWERYAAERAAGVRVPPSVSTWREADVRRQAEAHAASLPAPRPVEDEPAALTRWDFGNPRGAGSQLRVGQG